MIIVIEGFMVNVAYDSEPDEPASLYSPGYPGGTMITSATINGKDACPILMAVEGTTEEQVGRLIEYMLDLKLTELEEASWDR